ncbi:MAG: hypothetical protein P8L91_03950 [Candidatus Marinimicrobia bacterium]|nr:hypothetical protein [Candidatus Neomarinimicrobiota bacterium]
MESLIIKKFYQYWYFIFSLFLFIYSCDENKNTILDNPLVQGDSSAIIFRGDTLWIPQQLYCNGDDSGTWKLSDYNGAHNGGDYHVILLTWFASY